MKETKKRGTDTVIVNSVETGKRIKEAFKKQGLTLEDVSYLLNISATSVWEWTAGRIEPSLKSALGICNITGMKMDEMFCADCKVLEDRKEKLIEYRSEKNKMKAIKKVTRYAKNNGISKQEFLDAISEVIGDD